MPKRTICVVTGTRAEYGLLYWLMKEIGADEDLELQLVVTGTHLSAKYGLTSEAIEADGFFVDERVELDLRDDTGVGVCRSMATGVSGLAVAFDRLRPDVVVLLGDRFEIHAAATSATVLGLILAHIHGGEITEGVIDEQFRHAITKMAHLHFAAAEEYRQRIIQLGEQPNAVFTVGAPGLDNIDKLTLFDRSAISASVGLASNCKYFVVTVHPETAAGSNAEPIIDALLSSLERFPDHQVLFTGVNADPGRETFASRISSFAANQPERVQLHASLGQVRYLSAIKHAEVVIGNSSSGIIEVPALGVPTVNIGIRQRGRLKASSIIDCAADAAAIEAAIYQALAYDDETVYQKLPYGGPGASVRIKNVLRTADLTAFRKKQFFDIPMAAVT